MITFIRFLITMVFLILLTSVIYAAPTAGNFNNKELPFTFLENKGQWPEEILFKSQSLSDNVYLLKDGLSFSQVKNHEKSEFPEFIIWNLKFLDADRALTINGVEERSSVSSFLSGNDKSNWVIHPNEYKKVIYNKIYSNIDFLIYENESNLEYDYVIHPGGNTRSIKLYYENIQKITINKNGNLEVATGGDLQIQKAPVAWQIINGEKKNVNVEYVLFNDSTFGFNPVNSYNKNFDLIIDPLFQMVWSSYTKAFGQSNNINYCFANAMDKDGNVYLTGMVDGTFPVTPGSYSGPGNVYPDIFVAKFSSDGSSLIYSTYLPGNSSEFGTAIAIDDSGRAYVTGVVDLNITGITNFPSTPNSYQPVHNTGSDAFITVLNPTGTGLVYSSFLGGTGSETGYDITLGSIGIAYVTGNTSIGNFPVKASTPLPSGDKDLFVSKFDINQSGNNSLIYSVRIGGGSFCNVFGKGITVNNAGNVFVTGTIGSSFGTPNFPITAGAYNNVFNTGIDGSMCFAVKLSATTPVSLDYSTYLTPGTGSAIAVDANTNDAFVVGSAFTFSLPITPNALQPVHAGNNLGDGFALRLNAAGSALVYCTFLGGPSHDAATGVAVNSSGEAYVTGMAEDFFPTSIGAYQPNNAGRVDFFVVNINATGTGYACGGSTYIGGSEEDYSGSFYDFPSPKISIRDHGGNNDTVCVSSTSHSQDFPTTPGVYGPVKVNGIADQPVFFKLTCSSPSNIPVVNIASSDSTSCDKQTIDFYDLSTNSPTTWQWSFPGGLPGSSTLQNPIGIYYPASGTYDVTLIACNNTGCDTTTFPDFITALPIPIQPIVTIHGDTLCTSNYLSYQWYEVSTPSNIFSTDSCFAPTLPGNYIVSVVDSNSCHTSSQVVTILTGLPDQSFQKSISINPNPFHTSFTIEFSLNELYNIKLSILDIIGREIKSIPIMNTSAGNNRIEINLSDLPNGIYFCNIISNENYKSVKLIKSYTINTR